MATQGSRISNMTNDATIGTRAVSLDEAIEAASSILRASRNPIIAGLGTDCAGAQEAVALARAVGGSIDHYRGEAALRDLGVMRRAGWIVTTPLQACARADLIVVVGAVLAESLANLRLDRPPSLAPDRPRRVIHLDARELGILRALIGKRPVRDDARTETLAAHAEALSGARFGVAIWRAADLDELAIEMLCGLIDDLNKTTRFAGLPLDPGGNATGVIQAAAWRSGFPMRTGFGRGYPEHDPWRFDAVRMVESGEADAALWVSAIEKMAPPWTRAVTTIALTAAGTAFATPPEVAITVGRPGIDHDAVLFLPSLGTLGFVAADTAAPTVRAADVLARIASAAGPKPC